MCALVFLYTSRHTAIGNACKHIYLRIKCQQWNMQEWLYKNNSTNDRKNSNNKLNDLLEALMSDGGDWDVIETR